MKYLIPLAVAFGLTIASPAAAHNGYHEPVITGVTSCADSGGLYTVDWTIVSNPNDDGLDWSVNGITEPDSEAFHFHEQHILDEGPGVEFEAYFMWSDGDKAGRSGKISAPNPCEGDTVPATDVATTTPNTTTAPTIGEIPGPASVSTTSTVHVVTDTPVTTNPISTTPTPVTLPPVQALPRTGAKMGAALILAGIAILIGGCVLLARGPRHP